jgi:ketosteroid isomerase-like protein
MIFALIGAILLASVALEIIFMVILAFLDVTTWFSEYSYIYQRDTDNIAFTLKTKLATGDYETVQGIFNKRDSKVKTGRKVQSKGYDTKLANKHKTKDLVVWT